MKRLRHRRCRCLSLVRRHSPLPERSPHTNHVAYVELATRPAFRSAFHSQTTCLVVLWRWDGIHSRPSWPFPTSLPADNCISSVRNMIPSLPVASSGNPEYFRFRCFSQVGVTHRQASTVVEFAVTKEFDPQGPRRVEIVKVFHGVLLGPSGIDLLLLAFSKVTNHLPLHDPFPWKGSPCSSWSILRRFRVASTLCSYRFCWTRCTS